jgi:hypothetical protein
MALAMMSWLVRLLFAMVGSLAGCFVATCVDEPKRSARSSDDKSCFAAERRA